MLKIAVDARSLNTPHVRGIGRYLQAVIANANANTLAWQLYGARSDQPFILQDPEQTNVESTSMRLYGDRIDSWLQAALPYKAWRGGADILHCAATVTNWWQPIPTVVTIHDTIPFEPNALAEDAYEPKFVGDHLIPGAYRKAKAIITISEHSRQDILRHWPGLDSKLVVIPHGIDVEYAKLPIIPAAAKLEAPYLFYVGGTAPRKRLSFALELFGLIDNQDLQIRICGVPADSHNNILQSLPANLRSRVKLLKFVSDHEMRSLYNGAIATLYPTTYEGFGFPALESQACGTPVLMSPVSSLKELIGPGAIALDAQETSSWVAAVNQLLRDGYPHAKVESSRSWALKFSWERSALKHTQVYEQVLSASPISKS